MRKVDQQSKNAEASDVNLPETASTIAQQHAPLWRAFQQLGREASHAGPLDGRTRSRRAACGHDNGLAQGNEGLENAA